MVSSGRVDKMRKLSYSERAIDAIVNATQVKPRIEAAGWDVAGGTPEAFTTFMQAERRRWQPVIARSGAKLD